MHAIAVLLSLSLAATPVLIVLYVAYKILLSNDGRLNLNRRVLTLLPPLALFALPFVRYIGSSVKHTADGSVTVVSVASVVKIPDWIYWVYGGGIAVTLRHYRPDAIIIRMISIHHSTLSGNLAKIVL